MPIVAILELTLRSTNISDLRNRLTQYLKQVRAGEEIDVRDRQRPIAKIAFDDRLRTAAAALGFPCGHSRISALDSEGTWDHAASDYSR
jgi:antitoxin (DNA-binding transcriptional repressor) of toxin-antitoxin stability system